MQDMTTDTVRQNEPTLTLGMEKQYRTVLTARSCAVIRIYGKGFCTYATDQGAGWVRL